jgi:LysM repeat protein
VNPQIAGLQVALRAWGLYSGPIDGIAGPQTAAGLHAFQRRKGITSGVGDVRTRVALGPLGRPLFGARVLRLRDFGWDVSVLQFVLARSGFYRGALTGYFDRTTAVALRHFQRTERLPADAVVGPRTLSAIVRTSSVPVRPRPATKRSSVVYLVRPGDSLTAIAARFGTSVAKLAAANRLDPARPLLIGKRLRVPRAVAPAALAASSLQVRALLDTWSSRVGVDHHLVRALAWMESGYRTRLVSSAGARGVLQTLPSTRAYVETVLLGRKAPRTVSGDVEIGVVLLHHLLSVFGGDQRLALAAWYQGERAVRKHGMYRITRPFVADVLALRSRM